MISVGSSDARKGLGLGFGGGGREMEETELEEGEACSYNNNDECDASMDPDIALSYIDEKLQDVLGHFQKDFEGGVSAENLGAKFGGYGSFLPAYQRSPVWSHPKSPPKSQNYAMPRSPNGFQLEGARRNLMASSSAPSVRPGSVSISGTSLLALKAPSMNGVVKQETCVTSSRGDESGSRQEFVNKKSSNLSDQKTLKVRIKVGSDNLSTQKNAAIYSGLGLDVSPSSSLENSPSESEGIYHEDPPFESPSDIVMVMTSFPLHGDLLLSPLSDDLIRLIDKERILKDKKFLSIPSFGNESSYVLVNGSDSRKDDRKVLGEKNAKSTERNNFAMESKSGNNRDFWDSSGAPSKKDAEIDALACEELVSETLKLPLLSNAYPGAIETGKSMSKVSDVTKEGCKGVMRDKIFDDIVKEEILEPIRNQETGCSENQRASSAGRVWEDKKFSCLDETSAYARKDGHCKGERISDSVKSESNISKGKKGLKIEHVDSSKLKVDQKASWHEQDSAKLPRGREYLTSGGKKKSKGSQSHSNPGAEVQKESLRVGSSPVPNNKKNARVDDYPNKKESEEVKSLKDAGRAEDRYKDFFGDMVDSEEENRISSLEMKDSEKVEKSVPASNNVPKERLSSKKIDKVFVAEAYPKAFPSVASHSANGPISDAANVTAAPLVIEENWVCCDKCQKWRLLPLGMNPDNLPEKWLCSMLNWLPGMNRCSFSEEETTKALLAKYQVPAPEGQTSLHSNPGGAISRLNLADVQHNVQDLQNFGSHAVSSLGKKKQGLKEIMNITNKEGSTLLTNSVKKSMQASVKNTDAGCQSPRASEPDIQQVNKSSMPVERHKYKPKQKLKVVEPHSDGGNIKSSKMKSKRDADQDCLRVSKKIKTGSLRSTDEEWTSDHGEVTRKLGPGSGDGLPAMSAGKDRPKYHDRLKNSLSAKKDRLQVCSEKPKDKAQVSLDDGSLDLGNSDSRGVGKKRKVKESHDTQVYMGLLPSAGNHLPDGGVSMKEEFSENEYRKEKKVRVFNSEGKESSVSKGNCKSDKKGSQAKSQKQGQDLGSGLSHRSLDGVDSLKRDFGPVQPSVAATSSSSKVSGSHKTKASFHETKGSPVESVSSSPMRISNPDKLTLAGRKCTVKDESHDAGFFTTGSPRRCSDGEDDGGSDRSGTTKKGKTFAVIQHGSLGFFAHDFQDKDVSHLSSGKVKPKILDSPDLRNHHFTNGSADALTQDTRYPSKLTTLDECRDEERQNDNHYLGNASRPKKSGKGSSSRSKEKGRSSRSDSINEFQDHALSYEVKPPDARYKLQEKFGGKPDENETRHVDKKESTGKLSSESSKRESQSNLGVHDRPDAKVDAVCSQDATSTLKQSLPQEYDGEKSSKRFFPDKSDPVEVVSERGKSLSLPPSSGGVQNEMLACCPRPVSGSHKLNGADIVVGDTPQVDDALKVPRQVRRNDNQNGTQHINSRHATPNGHRMRDLDAPSPSRKESSSQAATNAVKEAKDLKHLADRLKNAGSTLESTELYFQAALKFLHGASLLEACSIESAKHGEMIQSMQMYSSTAKLCEFCAHEYEKSKEMAAAALAYKCMEVAYMRVIYSSHSSANRDRHELQMGLQMVPPGESPSSSASDVDNLNHLGAADRVASSRGVSSPQVAGNHVISARNRPNFVRLLKFAQDVNSAMEASRKSQSAFAAANGRLEDGQYGESISYIKRALDFNFHDVDGLLKLVRRAMEAINC